MSLDFGAPGSQAPHGMYGQELDQSFNGGDHTSNHNLGGTLPANGFDHGDGMEVSESPNYDLFSNSPTHSFASQRYRTNASSSSSLGQNYGLGGDSVYSHSFNDSVPSFHSSNSYDVGHSLPSSYGSGKVSPLTPNDAMQPPSLYNSQSGINGIGKEYPSQNGFSNLLPDRRTSSVNYGSDFPDDYGMDGVNNNGMNFQHPGAQYPERLNRFADSRYSSGVPTHMHNHNPEVLRGAGPQSAHTFRPDGSEYDLSSYMGSPTSDLSLRMPGVEETLSGIKLHGQSGVGNHDLQSFIRFVHEFSHFSQLG